MIYADHQGLRAYQQYLRQGRGKRRKRGGCKAKRGQIPGRVGIEHRPLIAVDAVSRRDAKTEIGHWESDTMIGANQMMRLFNQIEQKQRRTMTFDNGKEFSGHEELSKALRVNRYFANPYHS